MGQGGALAGPADPRGTEVRAGYRAPLASKTPGCRCCVPAEPVLPSGSQPAVSAGQLVWIARLPGTGPVLVGELLVRLPGGVSLEW